MSSSFVFRTFLVASVIATSAFPASADNYIFRYRQGLGHASPNIPDPENPGTVDPADPDGFGIGNDITVYFTGAIGYDFSKVIPVATQDVVEWKRVSGSYQPGLTLDEDAGVIAGVATGTIAERKALLMGYDASGSAIARADITFRFVNPVGAPQGLVFYGHTGKHMSREIPASVPVAHWEPLTTLPSEFSTQGRFLNGTPLKTYETGVAFVGYDYMNKEIAFTTGDLIVQDGPVVEEIADQHRHPDKVFSASASIAHKIGKLKYRLISHDGKPTSLGFNETSGQLRGTIPTFNTALRFQIEAVDIDGTKGVSNIFTFSTYAPDVDISKIRDMQGTAGTPFAVRLSGEDLSGEKNWQVIAGKLPEGLALDAETGVISGTPVKEEIQEGIVISVSTSDNGYGETKPFSFTVHHAQVVVSFEGIDVRTGESFTTAGPTLEKGITDPHSFEVADGAVVNPALTVDEATATVSGSLTTAGSHDVLFNFTNGDGRESVFNQPIQVYNPLSLAYDDTLTTYRRVPTSAEAVVSENSIIGDPAFTVETGALPEGLSLNSLTGGIYGTASAEGLTSGLSIRLADESGESVVSNIFSIDVQDRPDVEVSVQSTSIERYVENKVLVVTASNAFDGVTYEMVAGSLPVGLTFVQDGTITGSTSEAVGTYPGFQIRATDGEGYSALSPVFSLEIVDPAVLAPLDESNSFAAWTVGVPFSLTLPRPENAYGPVTYVLDDLPAGVSVSGDQLVGTVSDLGTHSFPMTLSDDVGRQLPGTFTLDILEPMTASLTGSSAQVSTFSFMRMASSAKFDLPRGSETNISASISNGIEPITHSFSGNLPDGLVYDSGRISGVPVTEKQSTSMMLTVSDAAGTVVSLPADLSTVSRLAIDLSYDFAKPVYLKSASTLPRKPSMKNAIGDVTFEVTAGDLPPGMKIDPKTGYITGAPTQDGRFPGIVITAMDSEGTQFSGSHGPFEIGVSRTGAVGLANNIYLTVRADRSFLHMLNVSNVTLPISFSPAEDGVMPHGLTLGTTDGSVSGRLAEGKYDAVVSVMDDFGRSKSTTMRITSVGALTVAAPSTRSFNQYASVNVKPMVTNSVGATRYELIAGTLPQGLALNASTGAISGVPTVVATVSGLVIRLTDATGDVVQTPAFNITITNRLPLALATASSYAVIANKTFKFTVPVTNAVGKVTWSQTGTLPPGISFNTDKGIFSGVATNIGNYSVTVTATDSVGGTATKTFTLSVSTNNQPINLAVTNFVTKVGHPISTAKPTYSNHVGDIRFWADDTLAQNGMSIDPVTGVITGSATELLDFTPNIHITDASDRVTSRPVRIQVIPNMVISFPERLEIAVNTPTTYYAAKRDNVVGTATWKYEGTLPTGVGFSTAQGHFSSANPKQMGTFRGILSSTDSLGDSASVAVEIAIVNNGLPPTIAMFPSSHLVVSYNAYDAYTPVHGNTKVGDVVTLAPDSAPLPPGMSIAQTASGAYVLRKTAHTDAQVGVYRGIKLRVTDVDGLYSESETRDIVYRSASYLTYPNVTLSSRADAPVHLDPPVPTAGVAIADVSFAFSSPTGQTLTIDPDTGEIGGYITATGTRNVTVTESYDGITIRTHTYNVIHTKLDPSLAMESFVAIEGQAYTSRVPRLINPIAGGTLSLSGRLPNGLTFDPATGTISGTPTEVTTLPVVLTYTDEYETLTVDMSVGVIPGDSGHRFWRIDGMKTYRYNGRIAELNLYSNNLNATHSGTITTSREAILDDDPTTYSELPMAVERLATFDFGVPIPLDKLIVSQSVGSSTSVVVTVYWSDDGLTWTSAGTYRSAAATATIALTN